MCIFLTKSKYLIWNGDTHAQNEEIDVKFLNVKTFMGEWSVLLEGSP